MKLSIQVVSAVNRQGTGKASGKPYSFTEVEGVFPTVDRLGTPRNRVGKVVLDGNVVLEGGAHEISFRPDMNQQGELTLRAHSITRVGKI